MQIDKIVDHCLPSPHGNRQGLSYGQLSLLFLCYVLYLRTHKLCSMESWVESHQALLCHLTGWELSRLDATDDRLGALLSCLGQSPERVEAIQTQLSRHQVLAFELGENPVVRHDFTAFNVHHAPDHHSKGGLLELGHSKDRRPDLLQFKQGLSTLAPSGVPLCAHTLNGSQADDPQYLPAWKHISQILNRSDFLFVTDSKGSALATRYQIQKEGGYYLCPLPMTSKVPEELQQRVLEEVDSAIPLFHIYTDGQEKRIGQGFEVQRKVTYKEGSQEVTWQERLLIVQSEGHAQKQLQALDKKLQTVISKLETLQKQSFIDMEKLENKVYSLLEKHQLVEVFQLAGTNSGFQNDGLCG